MRTRILLAVFFSFLLVAETSVAASGWSGYYQISYVDSLSTGNYTYLTLAGYSNANCNNNRIHLASGEDRKFDQMFSMVLSAFHSGAEMRFYFTDTANCTSTRVMIRDAQ